MEKTTIIVNSYAIIYFIFSSFLCFLFCVTKYFEYEKKKNDIYFGVCAIITIVNLLIIFLNIQNN